MSSRLLTLGALVVAGLAAPTAAHASPGYADPWPTSFHAFTSSGDFARGASQHVRQRRGSITLARGAQEGVWTSPYVSPQHGFSELVASWQATTPGGSWVEIGMQAQTATTTSRWFTMGRWAFENSAAFTRTSVDDQDDPIGKIYTDTFLAHDAAPGGTPTRYRLRVILHGAGRAAPTVRQVAATASLPGDVPQTTTSPTTMRRTVDLRLPSHSQEIHHGEYPAYDGGGEAWCSPTSTSMVLSYYGVGPTRRDVAALPADPVFDAHQRVDGVVDYAAIHVFDQAYDGAGNWPFNTAYASAYGLDGSVRQFASLRPVEEQVKRGVPVVVSIAWDNTDSDSSNDLTGSSITGTDGHLVVVGGFTASGDPIVYDPASPSDAEVRHVYQRSQFERDWLTASDGTTYVIAPGSGHGWRGHRRH
ncbi:peptidase C39 family protein [Nocardioides mangrovicus]|nr:peptidase C39 family protein [Nocardioides mangrovicus]